MREMIFVSLTSLSVHVDGAGWSDAIWGLTFRPSRQTYLSSPGRLPLQSVSLTEGYLVSCGLFSLSSLIISYVCVGTDSNTRLYSVLFRTG
jgi:hypothetical protein